MIDDENYWWNIIKRVICLRRALARLTRSCTKLLNGLTTIHSLSAGVFLRSPTDNHFYNVQIIYVIETTMDVYVIRYRITIFVFVNRRLKTYLFGEMLKTFCLAQYSLDTRYSTVIQFTMTSYILFPTLA